MLKILLLFFAGSILSCFIATAQDIASHRTIVLRDSDMVIRFSIPNTPIKLNVHRNHVYYYYLQNRIQFAQAGYTGTLLDGQYEALYASQALQSQGKFLKGEKKGRWRFWYSNGKLLREETWRNGRLHGNFTEYDAEGFKNSCGRYRKGYLQKVHTYNKGVSTGTIRYKRGEIREKKRLPLKRPKFKQRTSK